LQIKNDISTSTALIWMKQRPLHSELSEKSRCTQNLYNLAKTKRLSLTSPMPMSQFQLCQADGKGHSI